MLAPLQKTRDTMSKYMNKTTVQSNSIDTDIDGGGGVHRKCPYELCGLNLKKMYGLKHNREI